MPFQIEAEGFDRVAKKIEHMLYNQLGEIDVRETLVVWQYEDLHRKYPSIESFSDASATTLIHPRSIRPRVTQPTSYRRRVRNAARRIVGGKRPILRPELFEKLRERMVAMAAKAIKWP